MQPSDVSFDGLHVFTGVEPHKFYVCTNQTRSHGFCLTFELRLPDVGVPKAIQATIVAEIAHRLRPNSALTAPPASDTEDGAAAIRNLVRSHTDTNL
jgi:hypothetical protein